MCYSIISGSLGGSRACRISGQHLHMQANPGSGFFSFFELFLFLLTWDLLCCERRSSCIRFLQSLNKRLRCCSGIHLHFSHISSSETEFISFLSVTVAARSHGVYTYTPLFVQMNVVSFRKLLMRMNGGFGNFFPMSGQLPLALL